MIIENHDEDTLTYEQWIRFCRLYLMMPNLNEEILRSTFKSMTEHEVLRKFWTYDDSVQYRIGQKIVSGVSVKNVAAYIELCETVDDNLKTLTSKVFSFKNYSLGAVKKYLHSTVGPTTELFTASLFGVTVHINHGLINVDSWGDMHPEVLYMLQALYGDEIILDIMKRWMQSRASIDLHEMIVLANNWAAVKEYPIEWAVNVLK